MGLPLKMNKLGYRGAKSKERQAMHVKKAQPVANYTAMMRIKKENSILRDKKN